MASLTQTYENQLSSEANTKQVKDGQVTAQYDAQHNKMEQQLVLLEGQYGAIALKHQIEAAPTLKHEAVSSGRR